MYRKIIYQHFEIKLSFEMDGIRLIYMQNYSKCILMAKIFTEE